ncbi:MULTISPECIES: VOC family protein [unclassified Sphingomonas]|uniref:bleomycin resistance protein n=1 Tax=unclassified Sphingomonas TaxID=196159 RepID=UPI000BC5FDBB|nr:MAG: hypothetical protein B7Z43_01160 [Sphingomonas sp. 12-62-6]OYX40530.1 MAG: hypothetical protein B7Y98_01320 [Sphingomonas sp. 32-62-10]
MPPSLVPELYVSDFDHSLEFYTTVLGFRIGYARHTEKFAYLEREDTALMIEQPIGRIWLAGPLEKPFGRGINLQITVTSVDSVHTATMAAGVVLVQSLEQRDYRRATDIVTVRQFVIADPDGYLLRFAETIRVRPIERHANAPGEIA